MQTGTVGHCPRKACLALVTPRSVTGPAARTSAAGATGLKLAGIQSGYGTDVQYVQTVRSGGRWVYPPNPTKSVTAIGLVYARKSDYLDQASSHSRAPASVPLNVLLGRPIFPP